MCVFVIESVSGVGVMIVCVCMSGHEHRTLLDDVTYCTYSYLYMCSSCLGIQGGVSRGESRAIITDAKVINDESVSLEKYLFF